jgi:hypothetical protein
VTAIDATPIVDPMAPQTVNEGSQVTLSTGYHDPGTVDGLAFNWHVLSDNGDNIPDGTGPTFAFTPYDNGTYLVTFTVIDSDGGPSASTMTTITVKNVAPTASPTADFTTSESTTPVAIQLTSLTDSSSADTQSGFTYYFSLDGQNFVQSASPQFFLTPSEEGTDTVYSRVADQDGAFTQYTTTVSIMDPMLSATGGYVVTGMEATSTGNQTVATFTDPGGAEALGDYSATISWGDGKSSSGKISYDSSSGVFTVTGSHTYTEDGNPQITVQLMHDNTSPVTVSSSAAIADVSVSATGGFTVAATEGSLSTSQTVATFTDPAGAEALGDYAANIAWGDGQTSPGTITYSGGLFTVMGSYRYAEDGSKTVTVTLLHDSASSVMVTSTANVSDAGLSAAGQSFGVAEGASTGLIPVATFTDLGGPEALADYSATINWGDNTTDSGANVAIVLGSDGQTFSVLGSHTYAEEGNNTVTVTISHEGITPVLVTATATVSDVAVAAVGQSIGATEGTSAGQFTVATFTDPGGPEALTDYSAVVNWGDNSSSSGANVSIVLGNDGQTFSVLSSHTYAEEGTKSITITISHDSTTPVVVTGTAAVGDAALSASGVSISPIEATSFTGVVANFTDGNPAATVSDFSATITWGDGHTSAGNIAPNGNGGFSVTGTNTYAEEGGSNISVAIRDAGGSQTSAGSTATVSDPAVNGTGGFSFQAAVGVLSSSQTVATFTDPAGAEVVGNCAATINWGDTSTPSPGTITFSGGVFTVSGSHMYMQPGSPTITVTLAHENAQTVTVTSTTNVTGGIPSILVLNNPVVGAGAALWLGGNATLNIPGTVVVDSSASNALSVGDHVQLTATTIQVVGGSSISGHATVSPTPTKISPVADPLAGLPAPSTSGLVNRNGAYFFDNLTHTLLPGIYRYIELGNNTNVTMTPGLYLIEGGGLWITNNASVSGNGVTIYNAGSNYPQSGGTYGGITINSTGAINLTAPTTGTYAGIVLEQSRDNTLALALSSSGLSGLSGTIYAPNAQAVLSGNAQLNSVLDVGNLRVTGNVVLTQMSAGSDGAGDTSGVANTLLAGNLEIYINDPAGYFTADELARIQDAIDGMNALLVFLLAKLALNSTYLLP